MYKPLSVKNIDVGRYYRLVIYPIEKIRTERARKKLERLVDRFNADERKWALSIDSHPYRERYKRTLDKRYELSRSGATDEELKEFERQQEEKDFPSWNQTETLTPIKYATGFRLRG